MAAVVAPAGSFANEASGVGSLISAGTAIASTIASISDMNKRRKFEQTLAMLSNEQQQELNQQLLATNNDNTRLQMLTNAITNIRVAGVQTIGKNETTKMIVIAGSAVIVLGIIVFYYK
jgi:hypothetical protein